MRVLWLQKEGECVGVKGERAGGKKRSSSSKEKINISAVVQLKLLGGGCVLASRKPRHRSLAMIPYLTLPMICEPSRTLVQ